MSFFEAFAFFAKETINKNTEDAWKQTLFCESIFTLISSVALLLPPFRSLALIPLNAFASDTAEWFL